MDREEHNRRIRNEARIRNMGFLQEGKLRDDPRVQETVTRLVLQGDMVVDCPGCTEFYESYLERGTEPFAPRHRARITCESGRRNHCTCDTCF